MKITICIFFFSFISSLTFSQDIEIICNVEKQSRLELRLGASERFIRESTIPEFSSLYGLNPSIHLALPIKINSQNYLRFKLILGGSINNIKFNEVNSSIVLYDNTSSVSTVYSNIFAGIGIGKEIKLIEKERFFLKLPLTFNLVYFPPVETFSDSFIPVPSRNYEVEILANYKNETNFSIVPEISLEYHYQIDGCTSFSVGLFYSRGINIAHEGIVRLKRANGNVVEQSYSKPFNSFGISFGYGIFRAKK